MVQPAGDRALADEGVHQLAAAGAEFLLVLVATLHEVELRAAVAHRPLDVVQHQLPAGSVFVVVREIRDVKKAVAASPANGDLERDGHLVDAQRGDLCLAKRHQLGQQFVKKITGTVFGEVADFLLAFPAHFLDRAHLDIEPQELVRRAVGDVLDRAELLELAQPPAAVPVRLAADGVREVCLKIGLSREVDEMVRRAFVDAGQVGEVLQRRLEVTTNQARVEQRNPDEPILAE